MSTLKDLSNQLQSIKKQIPFATAQALTSVARQIVEAQKLGMQRNLDNPTPFTVNSVGSFGARKDRLQAKIFVRDIAASYLEPFEFGGQHKLNGQALLNPKAIKLNKYGNLARNKLAQLKGKPDVFIGKIGDTSGVFQRKKGKKSKKAKKRQKRSPNGVHRAREKQRSPKLLIQFGDALAVKPTLGYFDRANSMAQALMPGALSLAIEQALNTAK
ncbi:hypothetical protein [Yersinia pseudotuberculosis]|uniref:hypothetical protein n=1 Tax=Yersinia pseudotuberculosis TaxID=633 RepID=UPI00061CC10B|nr:hypothetical protein [Yersinia pseudotuberculosis]AYX13022.1 hypothetical protein EGX52_20910 [Yersinia pseudotuberculosis]MBO1567232.1 hypothetical protein [Yersinia pseudotuberculosis]MBO1604091.1 hypothetical protein [Yersinia pseudotuberculosis]CNI87716.1 Uncharacterised protein [Yersinia pseudotuberculosis]VEE71664.1 Uncharacterised protein [Yersinia pseudotuberculosis]